ncbi:MAG TPA: beta-ketoacyl synthase N-terminal-like domain-containing protein [Jatrophihabitans sp.]|jgi:PfaB family protein|uniref:beta-ketoacyl synthase N-terminal-like domain-containing protein n=1 Tax=Jatrophihabitans sp. TaxID=1932789 RepID=UPI002F0FAD89
MTNRFAVVGLSCLFPGASTPAQFWANLIGEVDSRGPAGQDVLDHVDARSVDEDHRITWTSGGWVRDDPSGLDLDGLMLPSSMLAELDRVYLWTLYVVRQAIADAAMDTSALARTGLVMGNYSFPTATSSAITVPRLHAGVLAGMAAAGVAIQPAAEPVTARRQDLGVSGLPIRFAAQALGLGGPQLALDAACASALYALQLSCSYLSTGQADVMLAGGVCAPDSALIHLAFSDLRAYPSNGVSQPFESTSTGITTGQGAGLMAIKRLTDAVRDGDQIYAVIDGIGLSADGSGRHLLAPNPAGQQRAYAAAYAAAGLRPADIDYIECHATGTALGDQTELTALAELHAGNSQPPLLGSVKGNVGHLLTVAGLTSLLKAVLAMRHGYIPPTIGVLDALASPNGTVGAAQIVRQGMFWPDRGGVRRAAVSAFGFGGTNAHVLLSACPEVDATDAQTYEPTSSPAVSIVGMGAHFGGLSTLESVERALYDTVSDSRPLPAQRWFGLTDQLESSAPAGAYVERIDIDAIRYQIPPNELAQFNPQHLLMLRVAEEALIDSGLAPVESGIGRGGKAERRIAVLIAMEMDPRTHAHRARLDIHQAIDRAVADSDPGYDRAELHAAARASVHQPISPNEVLSYIGNIVASRISARWNFTGPSFTVSGDTAGGAQALELAVKLLADLSVEAVLVGAVDLAAGLETVHAAMAAGGLSAHWQPGDGAAALVLRRTADLAEDDRRYADLEAVALSYPAGAALGGKPFAASPDAVAEAARRAFDGCGLEVPDIELVQTHTPGHALRDEAELEGLARVYSDCGEPVAQVALGASSRTVGDVGHAGALASVVTAALALHHGYIPGVPSRGGPLIGPAGSAFYTPERSRPWLRRDLKRPRAVAVSVLGDTGTAAHILLSARATAGLRQPVAWQLGGPLLLAVPAPDGQTLLLRLQEQLSRLDEGADPLLLCRAAAVAVPVTGLRAVIVGADATALRREINRLTEAIPSLLAGSSEAAREWSTPAGTYLSLDPIGAAGKLALVYPGAFTAYLGLGVDLFRLFPGLVHDVEAAATEPARTFRQDVLWPRSRTPLSSRELMGREQSMLADIPSMLAIGTSFAIAGTDVLRNHLRLQVQGALGYSLGESSMLFALNAWQRSSRSERRLSETPVFIDRLCGARDTVRQAWRLPDTTPDAAVWASMVLLCDATQVRQRLAGYDRLWLTHVNTAHEVVVAGSPDQLRELVEVLGCPTARPPAEHVMHCPVVDSELAELADLNRYPTSDAGSVALFTAGAYSTVDRLDSDLLADNIADTLRSCIDFPRLVEAAYDKGYRYFVEVGPAATCTRWIGESLKLRPHVAVSLDRRGQRPGAGVASVVARLLSHGLAVDLTALLGEAAPAGSRSLARSIELGGESGYEKMKTAVRRLTPTSPAALPAPALEPVAAPALQSVTAVGSSSAPSLLLKVRPTMSNSPIRPVPRLSSPADRGAAVGSALQQAPVGALVTRPLQSLSPSMIDFRGAPAGPRLVAALTRDRSMSQPPAGEVATRAATGPKPAGVIWDEADLLEFATGSIAAVFGADFAEVDAMSRRVRLPEPPYLFVTRVTDLQATTGQFTPSKITTEFDVPLDAWFNLDAMVPAAVSIEAGQCDLLLISYLGIDFRNRGLRVYRLLDSTLAFHGDLPMAGQTLRYEISINRFVDTGETVMFFFSYLCYADDKLILELKDACAGFFSDAELDNSLGVVPSVLDKRRQAEMTPTTFKPLLRTGKQAVSRAEVELLAAGRIAAVFGPHYDQRGLNPSLRLPDAQLRMIDEITLINPLGGPRRIGHLSAIKQLDPDGWYFRCHFTGDPVMPGSLVAEGGVQILQAYALSLGLQMCLPDARFQTVPGLETKVRVRGQVTPATAAIRYEVDIIELTLLPRPTVIADITVFDGDRAIISMQNFGVQVREKPGTPYRPELGGIAADFGRRNLAGEQAIINEMHLAHAAKGNLATAMGPEFEIYGDRHAPFIPNGDFQFVDRIMALTGTRGILKPGATMVTEYDSPALAWYYQDNAARLAPNCLLMETSLQAAILLGYYLGATLAEPELEFGIRNLDGKATWTRHVDLRGKTIRHSSRMLSSTAFGGTVLQNFEYELSCDGSVFYVGQSLFGYFTEEGLANQLGMDNGLDKPTWLALNPQSGDAVCHIELADDPTYYLDTSGGSLHLPDGQLRLLDSVDIVTGGGVFGAGYVHGKRRVNADDWYFSCHFHEDPVMPGSLGVEAILQAMQLYVIENDLAADIPNAVFALAKGIQMSWRYRGQILRTDRELYFEVSIKQMIREADRLVIIGDASLFKPGLRIYELIDIAIEVCPRSVAFGLDSSMTPDSTQGEFL